ncbi:MAG TPA: hypothetical protein VIO38_05755, partial [Rariglobus sp.]
MKSLFTARAPFASAGLAAFAFGALLLTPLHRAVAAPPTMGVYINGSDEAEHERYEDYTQQSMSPIISFGPDNDWEALTGRYVSNNQLRSPPYGLGWGVSQWTAAYRSRIVWSIPMLPRTGATLAA